jgi:D-alanyl-D-alanine-carboxypeptidase/D-alanyl-D-alanine-endopeptidase
MKAMLEIRRPAGIAKIGLAWHFLGEAAWHSGGTGGFRSFVLCELRARTGVVVLSNAFTPGGVDDIGGHLLNSRLPLADTAPPKQPTGIHLDPGLLDKYTGRYQLGPDRIFEITRDGDRLFAQAFAAQGVGGPKFEMFAESDKAFLVRVTGSQINFETGPDGRATNLIMRRGGRTPMHNATTQEFGFVDGGHRRGFSRLRAMWPRMTFKFCLAAVLYLPIAATNINTAVIYY